LANLRQEISINQRKTLFLGANYIKTVVMTQTKKERTQRRITRSYITSTISITLVLFILGIIGLLFINARVISRQVKESLKVSVFLKDQAKEADVLRLKKTLDAAHFVKSADLVDKQEAAKQFEQELGEDFRSFLGQNPLPATIDVHLQADYANPDSIKAIKQDLSQYRPVQDIYYHQDLILLVNNNIRKISLVISVFALLLLVVAVALINNTMRLTIYARRFSINTMQLVGATDGFIKKPFIIQSAMLGSVAALIAIALILGLVFLVERQMEGMVFFQGLAVLFAGILLAGIVISALAANFAVDKYLKMNTDELYF